MDLTVSLPSSELCDGSMNSTLEIIGTWKYLRLRIYKNNRST